jgi:hypothetical protein
MLTPTSYDDRSVVTNIAIAADGVIVYQTVAASMPLPPPQPTSSVETVASEVSWLIVCGSVSDRAMAPPGRSLSGAAALTAPVLSIVASRAAAIDAVTMRFMRVSQYPAGGSFRRATLTSRALRAPVEAACRRSVVCPTRAPSGRNNCPARASRGAGISERR